MMLASDVFNHETRNQFLNSIEYSNKDEFIVKVPISSKVSEILTAFMEDGTQFDLSKLEGMLVVGRKDSSDYAKFSIVVSNVVKDVTYNTVRFSMGMEHPEPVEEYVMTGLFPPRFKKVVHNANIPGRIVPIMTDVSTGVSTSVEKLTPKFS